MSRARRRTQEERTTETRGALMEAAVATVQRLGYGGATTAIIAQEAGVSRGALTHHFESRADLMAAVVQWVYDRELEQYAELIGDRFDQIRLADWPELIWTVLSRAGGIAVLEILQATRADAELAERVRPVRLSIEQNTMAIMRRQIGGDERTCQAVVRLLVWAVRGLTIEQLVISDGKMIRDAVDTFKLLLENSAPSGTLTDFHPNFRDG